MINDAKIESTVQEFIEAVQKSVDRDMSYASFYHGSIVVDMDPDGDAPAVPRKIRVSFRGGEEINVLWRGYPTVIVNDLVTLIRFAEGSLYEVYGAGGTGGSGGPFVPTSRTVTAGAGLTGGGSLATDITIDVVVGAAGGIIANANDIVLDWGTPTITTIQPDDAANAGVSTNPARSDHRHGIVAGIAGSIEPDDAAAEGVSTSFSRADHKHSIVAAIASGLELASVNAEGVATSFARSDHTHAISTSADPGAAAYILASTVAGHLTLVRINTDTIGDRSGGDLTISPTGDLLLDPTGEQVRLMADVQIQSNNWVSQTTGWSVSYAGNADFRNIFADTLQVETFQADNLITLAGALIITKSRARISRAFTIPSDGNADDLYVEDLEGFEGVAVFAANDIVRLRYLDMSGGGLILTDVWGVVTGYADEGGGEQSWTFTTSDDGGVDGETIPGGQIALDYGQTASGSRGLWEATVLDGASGANAPYSQVQSWAVNPWTPANWTTHVRLGNLRGITAVTEYGLYAGEGAGVGDSRIVLSDQTLEIHDIPMAFYDSGNVQRIGIDPDAAAAAVMMWAGASSSDPRFVVYGNGDVWLSSMGLSPTLSDQFFTRADGLLLLGPHDAITTTSWTSQRNQVATLSGAFHRVAGPWAGTQALMVERAATNLVENPSFETGVAWWFTVNVNLSQITTDAAFGSACAQVMPNTSGISTYIYQRLALSGSTTGRTFTLSAYVKASDSASLGDTLGLYMSEVGGASGTKYSGFSTVVLTKGWQRVTHTYTIIDNDRTYVYYYIFPSRDKGIQWAKPWVDGVQFEESAYATSYLDGSLGSGYSWSGTAHASTSTRTATDVSLSAQAPLLNGKEFTIRAVVQAPYDWDDTAWQDPSYAILWEGYSSTSIDRFVLAYKTDISRFYFGIDASTTTTANFPPFYQGDWLDIVVSFDYTNDEQRFYINGVHWDTFTISASAPTELNTWFVGRRRTAVYYWGGAVAEYSVFEGLLTAEQVAALYHRNAPLADAGALDTPGLYILDGKFSIASSTGTTRIEILPTQIAGYNAGTRQFWLNATDGKAYAGAGSVLLDVNGISLETGTGNVNDVKWYDGTSQISRIRSYRVANDSYLVMQVAATANTLFARMDLSAVGSGTSNAEIRLVSATFSADPYIYNLIGGTSIWTIDGNRVMLTTGRYIDIGRYGTATGGHPGSPATNYGRLYTLTDAGGIGLWWKASNGTESMLDYIWI